MFSGRYLFNNITKNSVLHVTMVPEAEGNAIDLFKPNQGPLAMRLRDL